MMTIYPSRCSALAKKELIFMGPFGPASWLAGLVFIDRLNAEKARGTLEKTANYILKENVTTIIWHICFFLLQEAEFSTKLFSCSQITTAN